jgi:hypothetical protein
MVQGEAKARYSLAVLSTIWLRDYMETTMKSTMKHIDLVMEIVKKADRQLYRHLNSISEFNSVFCVGWILTWFSHQLRVEGVARLFDVLLSTRPEFVIYVSASLLLQERAALMEIEMDMSDFHSVIKGIKFKKLDVETLLQESKILYDSIKISTRGLGRYSAVNTHNSFLALKPDEFIDFKAIEKWSHINVNDTRRVWNRGQILLGVGVGMLVIGLLKYYHDYHLML